MWTQYARNHSSTIPTHKVLVVKDCGINAWMIFYVTSTNVWFVNMTSHDPHRTASNHIHRLTARMWWVLILSTHFFLCKVTLRQNSKSLSFLSFFLSCSKESSNTTILFNSPIKTYIVIIELKGEEAPKCTFTRMHSINAWASTSHKLTTPYSSLGLESARSEV